MSWRTDKRDSNIISLWVIFGLLLLLTILMDFVEDWENEQRRLQESLMIDSEILNSLEFKKEIDEIDKATSSIPKYSY